MRYESSADRAKREPQMAEGEFYAHDNGSVELLSSLRNVFTYSRLDSAGTIHSLEIDKATKMSRKVAPTSIEEQRLRQYKYNRNLSGNRAVAQDRIALYQWYHHYKNQNPGSTKVQCMELAVQRTGIETRKEGESKADYDKKIQNMAHGHERSHLYGSTNCSGW